MGLDSIEQSILFSQIPIGSVKVNIVGRLVTLVALSTSASLTNAQTPYSSPTRDVENPDRSAFESSKSISFLPGTLDVFLNFPTPTGKRYFVDFVALRCGNTSGEIPIAEVVVFSATNPNPSLPVTVPLAPLQRIGVFLGTTFWSTAGPVKAFADPDPSVAGGGTSIQIRVITSGAAGFCLGYVNGHTL